MSVSLHTGDAKARHDVPAARTRDGSDAVRCPHRPAQPVLALKAALRGQAAK